MRIARKTIADINRKENDMRRLFLRWELAFASLMFMLMVASPLQAEVPSPDTIQAMGIYKATVDTDDDWPDNLVNYNVTDSVLIADIISGIEADTLRDCSRLKARNNAYLYIKFKDGTRRVYHLFLHWSHFSAAGQRGTCYYVNSSSQELFRVHAQE